MFLSGSSISLDLPVSKGHPHPLAHSSLPPFSKPATVGWVLLTVYQSDPCSIITSLSDPTMKVSQLLKTCVIRLDLLDNLA